MRFYLGTHLPGWLNKTDVPLFVSRRRLSRRKSMVERTAPWALDSGGFTELSMYGEWTVSAREYAADVRHYMEMIPGMQWAAPQDWMCEPWILEKTGLTVAEHQTRTVNNLLDLRGIDPALPIIPVLQGWELGDYLRHVEMYARAGIDLEREHLVGLGTVCRRQHTEYVANIVLALQPIRLHGFGVKAGGLRYVKDLLASADSMAWSYAARMDEPLPGHSHRNCANCLPYALAWRTRLLVSMEAQAKAIQQQMVFAA